MLFPSADGFAHFVHIYAYCCTLLPRVKLRRWRGLELDPNEERDARNKELTGGVVAQVLHESTGPPDPTQTPNATFDHPLFAIPAEFILPRVLQETNDSSLGIN